MIFPGMEAEKHGVQVRGVALGDWEARFDTGHFTAVQVLANLEGAYIGTVTIDGYAQLDADGTGFTVRNEDHLFVVRDQANAIIEQLAASASHPMRGFRMRAGNAGFPERVRSAVATRRPTHAGSMSAARAIERTFHGMQTRKEADVGLAASASPRPGHVTRLLDSEGHDQHNPDETESLMSCGCGGGKMARHSLNLPLPDRIRASGFVFRGARRSSHAHPRGATRRSGEIIELIDRDDVRVVSLLGPGGVGKTRLAHRSHRGIGPSFAHGARFVPLDPIRDPALVPAAVARSLGLHESEARSAEDLLSDLPP